MRRALLAAGLALAAAALPAPAQETLRVGIALAKGGQSGDLGTQAEQGLALWVDEVNAAGGLLGRKVELRQSEEGGDALAARAAYERLIDAERADVLIGPPGSAATLIAAGVAEARRRVLINATGMSQAVHRQSRQYVFQVPPPALEHGAPALAFAQASGVRQLLVQASGDGGAAAERIRQDAAKLGITIASLDAPMAGGYPGLVAKARAARVDGWIAMVPGHEAAAIVKALKEARYVPPFFLAEGTVQPAFVREVGQDAEFALGLSVYEPLARTRGNEAFVKAYRTRYKQAPGWLAACTYAAGQVLEAALRAAGSLDQEALRGALSKLRTETLLGAFAVDAGGVQTAARPFVVQIQRGRHEVVWPKEFASAEAVLPYPAWSERKVIKR